MKDSGVSFALRIQFKAIKLAIVHFKRTRRGTTDWFQIGKGVHQVCILSPCLFNLYVEYIMRNARLDEAQAGIKIARRNINNINKQMTLPYGRK